MCAQSPAPKFDMTFRKCLKINESRALTGNDFRRMFEAALNKISHKNCKILYLLS